MLSLWVTAVALCLQSGVVGAAIWQRKQGIVPALVGTGAAALAVRSVAVLVGAVPSSATGETGLVVASLALALVMAVSLMRPSEPARPDDLAPLIKNAIEASPTPLMIKNAAGYYIYVNKAFTDCFGQNIASLRGHTADEIWPNELTEKVEWSDRDVLANGAPRVFHIALKGIDGRDVDWLVKKFPITLADGRAGIAALYTDISEQRMSERRLAESEERFALASQHAGIWDWDIRNDGFYASPAFAKMMGLNEDEREKLTLREISRLIHPDDYPTHRRLLEVHIADPDKPYVSVHRFRMPDGEYRWFRTIGRIIIDDTGRCVRMTGMITDIDAERRSAEALKLSQAQIINLLDNSPAPIYFKDRDLRFILVNRRYTEVYGYETKDLLGKTSEEVFCDSLGTSFVAHDKEVLKSGRLVVHEENINNTIFMTAKFPIIDFEGALIGIGGIETDITERVKVEEAYRKARDQAEAANRAKSSFLANMSHELRTPLNSIIGFSDSLLSGTQGNIADKNQREYLSNILSAGSHLLELINDILDLSRIESGQMELEETDVDIAAIVAGVLGLTAERANSAGIQIVDRIDPNVPRVRADERQIRQVLLNLLSNALKFTHSGGKIRITAGLVPNGDVAIEVRDNGIGIAPDDLARVQQPFIQVADSQTRDHEGTGLGLAIVKSIVELHSGEFRLASTPGHGTTARFTLPAKRLIKESDSA
tara:strand:+ start:22641 stop:24773 length:2133 start_codon:yes stop_codon:yes gene_type:complete